MPAPYSDDLRLKVLEAVERGERKSDVSRMFNVSRNSIDLWLRRREATGSVSANRDYPRGRTPKIEDLEAFRAFAQANGHLTQQQMAQQWQGENTNRTIGKALKRIGFTRKKKPTA